MKEFTHVTRNALNPHENSAFNRSTVSSPHTVPAIPRQRAIASHAPKRHKSHHRASHSGSGG